MTDVAGPLPRHGRGLRPWLAGVVVFATSAAVLILEILAVRLLAPYVGVSLQTYTGIIGVVLAGIALGAWAGGAAADRVDPRQLIGPLVVLGGLFAIVCPAMVRATGSAVSGASSGAILTLATVGFLAPATALSAVTPAVIKLQLRHVGETGTVVGRLSALSSVGAIVGTLAAGFVLVSAATITALIVGIGITLVAAGGVLWWWLHRIGLVGAVATLAAAALVVAASVTAGRPCDAETTYYCARVVADPDRPSGRVLVLDDMEHSYVDLEDPTYLGFRYQRVFASVIRASAPPGPLDAMHIGGGGFTLPRYLHERRPGTRSVIHELDRGVVELAERRLGLVTSEGMAVRIGDARLALRREPADSADLVVGDAFGGRSVPWHLTTVEFVADIERVLRPGGVYVVNLIDSHHMRFARGAAATLGAVFDHVLAIGPPGALAGDEGANVVLAASHRPLDTDALRRAVEANGDGDRIFAGAELDRFVAGARVLRDGFAPVDQYVAWG